MNKLTRRSLLAQLAVLGCSKSPPEQSAASEAKPSPWKLAVGLNGFGSSETHHGKKYDYNEILSFARDEGFAGIELWRSWRGGYPDPQDDEAIKATRDKIESYGLQAFSIQSGVRGLNPVSADAAERATYAEELKAYVDLAVKLGCADMGVWPSGKGAADGLEEDQMIERFANALGPVVSYAREQGIPVSIEGEPPLIINQPSHYHKLLAAVPDLKIIFDPSHFDILGGAKGRPEDLLLELGVDKIGYIQFSDGDSTLRPFPAGGAGTSRHLPCGQGVYDIPKLCKILHYGGFAGWFQMDSWATEDAYDASKTCKDSVADYLKSEGFG